MLDLTPITPPRVPLIDARTGLIERSWYMFFLSLFKTAEGAEDVIVTPSTEALIASYDEALLALANSVQTTPAKAEQVVQDELTPAQAQFLGTESPSPAQPDVVLPNNVTPGQSELVLPDNLAPVVCANEMPDNNGTIASATSLDLTQISSSTIDVTGTTIITSITISEGQTRTLRFTGALVLTNGASLVLLGGANITTVAGDYGIFRGYAAGVVRCVSYSQISSSADNLAGLIHAATSKTTPADADELPLSDSAASFGLKKLTWANLKATLATWINGGLIPASFTTATAATGMAVGGATAGTGGIAFPATAVAVANVNTLDDYEEGTWTPIDSSGAGLSFTGASGHYTKIGRQVTITASLTYPATASVASAVIGGIPFLSSASGNGICGAIRYTSIATATVTFVSGSTSATTVSLLRPGVNTTNAGMSGGSLAFSAVYYV